MNITRADIKDEFFPRVQRWVIPESIFRSSFEEMARDGINGCEGTVLWLGRRLAGTAEISHGVALRGPGVVKGPAFLQIDADTMNEVTELAGNLDMCLIGQIHAHGPGYGVDLSLTDHRYGVRVPYFLSIVAPDYALRPNTSILDCGIHVFVPGRGFVRLSDAQVHGTVVVSKATCLGRLHVVGENG